MNVVYCRHTPVQHVTFIYCKCSVLVSVVLPTYDVSMRPPRYEGPAMRVLSWNVASLRSMLTKVRFSGCLDEFICCVKLHKFCRAD